MNFDVTRFGFYTAGAAAKSKQIKEAQEKKVEKKEIEAGKVESKKFDANSLEALSLQNIAGMKLAKRVDDETAKDLADMFAMAGLSAKYMPTNDVYERIASAAVNTGKYFENAETEQNIRKLFASNEFKRLDEAFGII